MIYDLKKRAEEELVNNLGHFWLKLIDNENGGFYGEVTYDLKANKKSEKVEFKHLEYCGSSQRLIVQQKMKNIKKLPLMLMNF